MTLNHCVLYDINSLVEMYDVNGFQKYTSHYFSIGNDNSDRELIMKTQKEALKCGFLDARSIGTSEPDVWFNFTTWIEKGCLIEEENKTTPKTGNIVVINIPQNKKAFLIDMKKVFSLNISTNILLQNINLLPYIIVENIHMSKAQKLTNKTKYPECYYFYK